LPPAWVHPPSTPRRSTAISAISPISASPPSHSPSRSVDLPHADRRPAAIDAKFAHRCDNRPDLSECAVVGAARQDGGALVSPSRFPAQRQATEDVFRCGQDPSVSQPSDGTPGHTAVARPRAVTESAEEYAT
jgi:hypothetical protein